MTLPAPAASAEPFFLEGAPGQRFCLFHPPAPGPCRGALLYVHPFADEMNKARRVAALQARALAAAGFGVLQIDLYGCGDSSGDFSDARWDLWKQDLAAGHKWLAARLGQPVSLLGLRLGALLALDYATDCALPLARVMLWQPVQSGAIFLKQFLRLLTANDILSDGKGAEKSAGGGSLRDTLLGGQALEVGGYEIAPALGAAIDALDAAKLAVTRCPVDWFEVVSALDRPESVAVTRLAGRWREHGIALQMHRVVCPPFWATLEIAEAPELVATTTQVLLQSSHELSRTCA
jgi:exosortase A-associated hydrolase 2